jgi:hypothetical protein
VVRKGKSWQGRCTLTWSIVTATACMPVCRKVFEFESCCSVVCSLHLITKLTTGKIAIYPFPYPLTRHTRLSPIGNLLS